MHPNARLVLFPLLCLLTNAGAGVAQQPRDLSTPATRLVGHWVGQGNDSTHYYFGPIDSTSGRGSLVQADHRSGGRTLRQEYRLDKPTAGREQEVTLVLILNERERRGVDRVVVAADGLTADWITEIRMVRVHRALIYVDGPAAPR